MAADPPEATAAKDKIQPCKHAEDSGNGGQHEQSKTLPLMTRISLIHTDENPK